jgi:hypothetical protein
MLTALFTFLASAGARLAIGKLFESLEKWQDNRNEIARMRVQADLEAAAHERNLAALRLQHDLGIRTIDAQSSAETQASLMDAFNEAVRATRDRTGVWFIDAWNGVIRPLLATIALGLWVASIWQRGGVLDDWDRGLMASAIGIFVGGRIAATGR